VGGNSGLPFLFFFLSSPLFPFRRTVNFFSSSPPLVCRHSRRGLTISVDREEPILDPFSPPLFFSFFLANRVASTPFAWDEEAFSHPLFPFFFLYPFSRAFPRCGAPGYHLAQTICSDPPATFPLPPFFPFLFFFRLS